MRISLALAILSLASFTGAASLGATAADSPVAVEYYDLELNHFFVTAGADEIQALDSGRFFGWVATGLRFPVLAPDDLSAGSTPVCRFYGSPSAGLDSHFYSADPAECARVSLRWPLIWLLESSDVFRAYLPDMSSGACPGGTTPIFRLFNNRPDVNHRYTDRADVAQAMMDIGYVAEGYGTSSMPIAFCAPASNTLAMSCTVSASSVTPLVGSNVMLTAACDGNPTQYAWTGCASSSPTCVVTSAVPGTQMYWIKTSNGSAISAPAGITLAWQERASPPGSVSCSLTPANASPAVGSSTVLTATCTGNPTSYSWGGCTSSTNTCVATSSAPGSKSFSVSASNGSSTSAPASVNINWQTLAGVSCALGASNASPVAGASITLTATCTGNPTSYSWVGCTSSTNTCGATSAVGGSRTYSVSASNGTTTSSLTSIGVTWQAVGPPTPASCVVTATNSTPLVGSNVTLTAGCTGSPTSYSWVGCTSSSGTCVATSSTAGSRTYSVTAGNATSTSPAATIGITWFATPPPGLPASADFIRKATDPRGGDNGYNSFRRLPDGRGISFGGFSHDRRGNNAVAVYNPVNDAWEIAFPNRSWVDGATLPDGSTDARGLAYLGNRDNHGTLINPSRNEAWFLYGARGINVTGNYAGQFNYITKTWTHIEDLNSTFAPVEGWTSFTHPFDGASMWDTQSDTGIIYTSWGDFNHSCLTIIRPNPGGATPYKAEVHHNLNGPTFSGERYLQYTSNQGFVRRGKFYIYAGYDWQGGSSAELHEIDVSVAGAPVMRVVARNTLPDGQRVDGQAILADIDPIKDQIVITNGNLVNVYDFASGAWVNVPVNTPVDLDRQSPSDQGAGRAGFYSPDVGQYIILGGHAQTYGLRLNYGGTPPPPPTSVSCTLAASSTNPVVGSNITVAAACTGSPTSYTWVGCTSSTSTCVATSATAGSRTYSLSASNASSTSAPATATVTWQVTPPPPPPPPPPPGSPPPPSAGTLTITTTPVSYTGYGGVLGRSKNLDFARIGNRWFKTDGDHQGIDPNGPSSQDGRQEILSFNTTANDWRMDQPYYIIDRNQVQFAFPDDAFSVAVENEIWFFPGPTANQIPSTAVVTGNVRKWYPATPANAAQQVYGAIMAWNPSTRLWRIVNQTTWPTGLPWRGVYDPVRKIVIVPGSTPNGVVFFVFDALTGADITPKAGPDYIGNRVIPGGIQVAGLAVDWPNRIAYVLDVYDAKLYSIGLDTFDRDFLATFIADIPFAKQTGDQGAFKITWEPNVRAVIMACDSSGIMAYQPDANALTVRPRLDGFVNGVGTRVSTSTIFYDPDTTSVISIGTMDWDTSINPGVYWRLQIH